MQTKKPSNRSFLLNGVAFFILIALTFLVIFRNSDLERLKDILITAQPLPLLLGAGCMLIFIVCEALNIRRVLLALHEPTTMRHCLEYACVGFFFSAVTPSASGGDPMQLYYMSRDRLNLSASSLAIFLDLAGYQLVTVLAALTAYFSHRALFDSVATGLRWMLALGVIINILILAFLLFFLFSKPVSSLLVRVAVFLMRLVRVKNLEQRMEQLQAQLGDYHRESVFIRQNKPLILKNLLTTMIQVIAVYSIPFLVYHAFGLSTYSYLTILSLQAVLSVSVSIVPLPGAVGASELAFLSLFTLLYSGQQLESALLLTRGLSFYLFVFLTGAVLTILKLRQLSKPSSKKQPAKNTPII